MGICLPRVGQAVSLGGAFHKKKICIFRYVPRERPPFSAPNFRSGASPFYIFAVPPGLAAGQSASQTRPTKSVPETPTFTLELAPEPRIFTLELTPGAPRFSFCRGTHRTKISGEFDLAF